MSSSRRTSDPWFPRKPLKDLLGRLIERYSTWDERLGLLFSLCLAAWCLYNIVLIVIQILAHNAIISLTNHEPRDSNFPAITICGPSIFSPKKLAELYPEFRAEYEKDKGEWVNITILKHRYELVNEYESRAMAHFSAHDVIVKQSLQVEEIVPQCQYYPVTLRNTPHEMIPLPGISCALIKPVVPSIYYGRKCFTYFSDLVDLNHTLHIDPPPPFRRPNDNDFDNQSDQFRKSFSTFATNQDDLFGPDILSKMIYDLNPHIELEIDVQNIMWDFVDFYPMLFIIHPPNVLQNQGKHYKFDIQFNSRYEISFTQDPLQLLPEPYPSACVAYGTSEKYAWYRTSDNCYAMCVQNHTYHHYGCANFFSVLTEHMFAPNDNTSHICAHDDQDINEFYEAKWKCANHCPEDCTQTIYHIEGLVEPHSRCYYVDFLEKERQELEEYGVDDLDVNQNDGLDNDDNNEDEDDKEEDNDKSTGEDVKCYSRIIVKMGPDFITHLSYKGAMQFEEYIGAIGGHIGIWLGMSIFSLVSIAINTLYPFVAVFIGRAVRHFKRH